MPGPPDRGLLLELEAHCFPFQSILTASYLYSRPTPDAESSADASDELYDLRTDPLELENIVSAEAPSAAQTELTERLDALADCSGIKGRDQPTDRPFCE